ncbi:unnamed protein product [Anisakis simplex]|uniref:Uncharacterized protein n=1 Tax=Anisakis simplex TaxID=6269 RepID=A0A3P6RMY9_ANISI|nr:unnamed protein product [Anisakis simplex]
MREQLNEMNETVREHLNEMKTLKDMFREETEKLRKAEKRNEELQYTVDELRSSLDDTNEQLNVIKEKRNAENVFSLEIADYEKSLEKVQKELKMTKDDCASLNAELELARSEANTIRDEKQAISQKFTKMKSAVVKLKAELDEKKDIINGLETDKRSMEETIKKLTDNRTDEKMEFSAAIAAADEKTRQLEATCVSLNKQLVSLRSQRESLQRQYDDLVQEHTTFKTRALYVLEQKKGSDDGEPSNKDEIEQLEQTIQQQTKTIENLTHTQRATHEELCSVREHSLALSVQLREVERQLKSSNETHKSKLSEQRNEFESRLAVESKLNGELMAQIDANFMAHSQEKERILADAERDREKLNDEIDTLRRSLDAEIKRRKEAERNKSPANIVLAPRQRKESGVFEVNRSV